MNGLEREVRGLIRDVPDFPRRGVLFRDLTPLLRDAPAFGRVVSALARYARRRKASALAAVESRGFLFGGALALRTGLPLVPIRKKGKLPGKCVRQAILLEYGRDVLEIRRDAVGPGQRVLVLDDVLATGGTLEGACRLVERVGGVVAGCACVVELGSLKGRERLRGRDVFSLVRF